MNQSYSGIKEGTRNKRPKFISMKNFTFFLFLVTIFCLLPAANASNQSHVIVSNNKNSGWIEIESEDEFFLTEQYKCEFCNSLHLSFHSDSGLLYCHECGQIFTLPNNNVQDFMIGIFSMGIIFIIMMNFKNKSNNQKKFIAMLIIVFLNILPIVLEFSRDELLHNFESKWNPPPIPHAADLDLSDPSNLWLYTSDISSDFSNFNENYMMNFSAGDEAYLIIKVIDTPFINVTINGPNYDMEIFYPNLGINYIPLDFSVEDDNDIVSFFMAERFTFFENYTVMVPEIFASNIEFLAIQSLHLPNLNVDLEYGNNGLESIDYYYSFKAVGEIGFVLDINFPLNSLSISLDGKDLQRFHEWGGDYGESFNDDPIITDDEYAQYYSQTENFEFILNLDMGPENDGNHTLRFSINSYETLNYNGTDWIDSYGIEKNPYLQLFMITNNDWDGDGFSDLTEINSMKTLPEFPNSYGTWADPPYYDSLNLTDDDDPWELCSYEFTYNGDYDSRLYVEPTDGIFYNVSVDGLWYDLIMYSGDSYYIPAKISPGNHKISMIYNSSSLIHGAKFKIGDMELWNLDPNQDDFFVGPPADIDSDLDGVSNEFDISPDYSLELDPTDSAYRFILPTNMTNSTDITIQIERPKGANDYYNLTHDEYGIKPLLWNNERYIIAEPILRQFGDVASILNYTDNLIDNYIIINPWYIKDYEWELSGPHYDFRFLQVIDSAETNFKTYWNKNLYNYSMVDSMIDRLDVIPIDYDSDNIPDVMNDYQAIDERFNDWQGYTLGEDMGVAYPETLGYFVDAEANEDIWRVYEELTLKREMNIYSPIFTDDSLTYSISYPKNHYSKSDGQIALTFDIQWAITDLNTTGNHLAKLDSSAVVSALNQTSIIIRTGSVGNYEYNEYLLDNITIEFENDLRVGAFDGGFEGINIGNSLAGADIYYQGDTYVLSYYDFSDPITLQGLSQLETSGANYLLGAPDSYSEDAVLYSWVQNPSLFSTDSNDENYIGNFISDINDDIYGQIKSVKYTSEYLSVANNLGDDYQWECDYGQINEDLSNCVEYVSKWSEKTDLLKIYYINNFKGWLGDVFEYNSTYFKWDGNKLSFCSDPEQINFENVNPLSGWTISDAEEVYVVSAYKGFKNVMKMDYETHDTSAVKSFNNISSGYISFHIDDSGFYGVETYISFDDTLASGNGYPIELMIDNGEYLFVKIDGIWVNTSFYIEENEDYFNTFFEIYFNTTLDIFTLYLNGMEIGTYEFTYDITGLNEFKISSSQQHIVYLDDLVFAEFNDCSSSELFNWEPTGIYNEDIFCTDVKFDGSEYNFGYYWNGTGVRDNYFDGSMFYGYGDSSQVNSEKYYVELKILDYSNVKAINSTHITFNCDDLGGYDSYYDFMIPLELINLIKLENGDKISDITSSDYKLNSVLQGNSILNNKLYPNDRIIIETNITDFIMDFLRCVMLSMDKKPIELSNGYAYDISSKIYSSSSSPHDVYSKNNQTYATMNLKGRNDILISVGCVENRDTITGLISPDIRMNVLLYPVYVEHQWYQGNNFSNIKIIYADSQDLFIPMDNYIDNLLEFKGQFLHNYTHFTNISIVEYKNPNFENPEPIIPSLDFDPILNRILIENFNRWKERSLLDIFWERYSDSLAIKMKYAYPGLKKSLYRGIMNTFGYNLVDSRTDVRFKKMIDSESHIGTISKTYSSVYAEALYKQAVMDIKSLDKLIPLDLLEKGFEPPSMTRRPTMTNDFDYNEFKAQYDQWKAGNENFFEASKRYGEDFLSKVALQKIIEKNGWKNDRAFIILGNSEIDIGGLDSEGKFIFKKDFRVLSTGELANIGDLSHLSNYALNYWIYGKMVDNPDYLDIWEYSTNYYMGFVFKDDIDELIKQKMEQMDSACDLIDRVLDPTTKDLPDKTSIFLENVYLSDLTKHKEKIDATQKALREGKGYFDLLESRIIDLEKKQGTLKWTIHDEILLGAFKDEYKRIETLAQDPEIDEDSASKQVLAEKQAYFKKYVQGQYNLDPDLADINELGKNPEIIYRIECSSIELINLCYDDILKNLLDKGKTVSKQKKTEYFITAVEKILEIEDALKIINTIKIENLDSPSEKYGFGKGSGINHEIKYGKLNDAKIIDELKVLPNHIISPELKVLIDNTPNMEVKKKGVYSLFEEFTKGELLNFQEGVKPDKMKLFGELMTGLYIISRKQTVNQPKGIYQKISSAIKLIENQLKEIKDPKILESAKKTIKTLNERIGNFDKLDISGSSGSSDHTSRSRINDNPSKPSDSGCKYSDKLNQMTAEVKKGKQTQNRIQKILETKASSNPVLSSKEEFYIASSSASAGQVSVMCMESPLSTQSPGEIIASDTIDIEFDSMELDEVDSISSNDDESDKVWQNEDIDVVSQNLDPEVKASWFEKIKSKFVELFKKKDKYKKKFKEKSRLEQIGDIVGYLDDFADTALWIVMLFQLESEDGLSDWALSLVTFLVMNKVMQQIFSFGISKLTTLGNFLAQKLILIAWNQLMSGNYINMMIANVFATICSSLATIFSVIMLIYMVYQIWDTIKMIWMLTHPPDYRIENFNLDLTDNKKRNGSLRIGDEISLSYDFVNTGDQDLSFCASATYNGNTQTDGRWDFDNDNNWQETGEYYEQSTNEGDSFNFAFTLNEVAFESKLSYSMESHMSSDGTLLMEARDIIYIGTVVEANALSFFANTANVNGKTNDYDISLDDFDSYSQVGGEEGSNSIDADSVWDSIHLNDGYYINAQTDTNDRGEIELVLNGLSDFSENPQYHREVEEIYVYYDFWIDYVFAFNNEDTDDLKINIYLDDGTKYSKLLYAELEGCNDLEFNQYWKIDKNLNPEILAKIREGNHIKKVSVSFDFWEVDIYNCYIRIDDISVRYVHTFSSTQSNKNNLDYDKDLLNYNQEITYGTNPYSNDTDNDGLSDYSEIFNYLTDPLEFDSDFDGLNDSFEVENNYNPLVYDMDNDLLSDGYEILTSNTNITNNDSDNDGLTDYQEFSVYHSYSNTSDSDNDGLTDLSEARLGYDPLNDSDPLYNEFQSSLLYDESLGDYKGTFTFIEYESGNDPWINPSIQTYDSLFPNYASASILDNLEGHRKIYALNRTERYSLINSQTMSEDWIFESYILSEALNDSSEDGRYIMKIFIDNGECIQLSYNTWINKWQYNHVFGSSGQWIDISTSEIEYSEFEWLTWRIIWNSLEKEITFEVHSNDDGDTSDIGEFSYTTQASTADWSSWSAYKIGFDVYTDGSGNNGTGWMYIDSPSVGQLIPLIGENINEYTEEDLWDFIDLPSIFAFEIGENGIVSFEWSKPELYNLGIVVSTDYINVTKVCNLTNFTDNMIYVGPFNGGTGEISIPYSGNYYFAPFALFDDYWIPTGKVFSKEITLRNSIVNFNNDTIGESPIGWGLSDAGGNIEVQKIRLVDEWYTDHPYTPWFNVVMLQDSSETESVSMTYTIDHSITSFGTDSITVSFLSNSTDKQMDAIIDSTDGNGFLGFSIKDNYIMAIVHGTYYNTSIIAESLKLYSVKMEINRIDETVAYFIDDTFIDNFRIRPERTLGNISFTTSNSDSEYIIMIEGIDYSWERDSYIEGQWTNFLSNSYTDGFGNAQIRQNRSSDYCLGVGDIHSYIIEDSYLYVQTYSSLDIYDCIDTGNPVYLSSIDFSSKYLEEFIVQGDYLYAAVFDYGFEIYNIADKLNPKLVFNRSKGFGSDYGQKALNLDIVDDIVYIGCRQNFHHNGEIWTYDISNPEDPVLLGELSLNIKNLYDMKVQDGFLYMTYAQKLDIYNFRFSVFEIITPTQIVLQDYIDGPLDGKNLNFEIIGDYAYVVSYDDNAEYSINVIDISVKTDIWQTDSIEIDDNIRSIVYYSNLIYLFGDENIFALDIDDPTDISISSTYSGDSSSFFFNHNGRFIEDDMIFLINIDFTYGNYLETIPLEFTPLIDGWSYSDGIKISESLDSAYKFVNITDIHGEYPQTLSSLYEASNLGKFSFRVASSDTNKVSNITIGNNINNTCINIVMENGTFFEYNGTEYFELPFSPILLNDTFYDVEILYLCEVSQYLCEINGIYQGIFRFNNPAIYLNNFTIMTGGQDWGYSIYLDSVSYEIFDNDEDRDGIHDYEEKYSGYDNSISDFLDSDTDGDHMVDGWEFKYGLNVDSNADATLDNDSDGLTNYEEFMVFSNPLKNDSDFDSLPDKWEVDNNLNPINAIDSFYDNDNDTLSNFDEFKYNSDPNSWDSDNDYFGDGYEIYWKNHLNDISKKPETNVQKDIPLLMSPMQYYIEYIIYPGGNNINATTYISDTNNYDNRLFGINIAEGEFVIEADNILDYTGILAVNNTPNHIRIAFDNILCEALFWINDSYIDSYDIDSYSEIRTFGFSPIGLPENNQIFVYGLGLSWREYSSYENWNSISLNSSLYDFIPENDPYCSKIDTDNDGITDNVEIDGYLLEDYGIIKTSHTDSDHDDDLLSDKNEVIHNTNPIDPDSDDDDLMDGEEIYATYGYITDPLDVDTDNDGLNDGLEYTHNVNPLDTDSDDDTLTDGEEVNIYGTEPDASDSDNDGLTDDNEINTHNTNPNNPDSDNDGLIDGLEINTYSSDPLDTDSDDDGLTDGVEVNTYSSDPMDTDSDDDGLTDGVEVNTYSSDPMDTDSDDDGLTDGVEVNTYQTNPIDPDWDDDGLNDGDEVNTYSTYIKDPDSDDDGLNDGDEVITYSTDPNDSDSDDDLLTDYSEVTIYNTDPNDWDSDDDDISDYDEVLAGYDPNNADSDNDGLNDYEEVNNGTDGYITDPNDSDTDDDSLLDGAEVNIHNTDPTDVDTDDDGINDDVEVNAGYDPTEADSDGDGLDDYEEINTGNDGYITDPVDNDSDDDGLNDYEEVNVGIDGYTTDPTDSDSDDDGLNDGAEYTNDTNPNDPDSDNDGVSDGDEVFTYYCDPLDTDTDDDGLTDGDEVNIYSSNPLDTDTDDDTISDGDEVYGNNIYDYTSDPCDVDSDDDGINDNVEINTYGTDPDNSDTDNDGLTDYYEIINSPYFDPLDPDVDNDGLNDGGEINWCTDPNNPDSDYDGLTDGEETCLGNDGYFTNPNNAHSDGDLWNDGDEYTYGGNPNDADSDDDGLQDHYDYMLGCSPTNPDSDGDGVNDGDEVYGNNIWDFVTSPTNSDTDGDGLDDYEELNIGDDGYNTYPTDSDSDDDGLNDGDEYTYGTHPKQADSDYDYLDDYDEVIVYNTDPWDSDSDDDGLLDKAEVTTFSTDPNDPDSDNDGLNDYEEIYTHSTDPNDSDSDNDGLNDYEEVNTGNDGYITDPNDSDSDNDGLNDGGEDSYNTNPNDPDTDDDSINDGEEVYPGADGFTSNPLSIDSDGDGQSDDIEIYYNKNPSSASSYWFPRVYSYSWTCSNYYSSGIVGGSVNEVLASSSTGSYVWAMQRASASNNDIVVKAYAGSSIYDPYSYIQNTHLIHVDARVFVDYKFGADSENLRCYIHFSGGATLAITKVSGTVLENYYTVSIDIDASHYSTYYYLVRNSGQRIDYVEWRIYESDTLWDEVTLRFYYLQINYKYRNVW